MRAITLILGASLWLLHSAVIGQPSRSNFVNRLLFSPSENPEQPASRMAGISSKPGNSQQFSWPNNTTGWQHYANSTYLYTSDGRLMQCTTVSAGNGQPTEQLSYTYNGANLAEKVRKIWRNNAWENDTRDVYVYDAANKLQELRYESWYNGAWTTDDGIRYLRTYNATGQLTSETMQTWVLTWENAVRETYTLGQANTWTEVLVETWNQNSWQPVERITNLVWHNWSKRELQSYLLKTFAQNTWTDAENATFSYSLTQQTILLDQPVPNGWEPRYRYFRYFDHLGNYLGFRDEELQTGNWVRNNENRLLLQYDADQNVTEQISQVLDYNNQTLVNNGKTVFQNFQTFIVAGTRPELNNLVSVYPNPAAQAVTIAVKDAQFQPATAILTDMSGRKILTRSFGKNAMLAEEKIDVAHLPAGVYLLELTSARGEQLKQRLVKN